MKSKAKYNKFNIGDIVKLITKGPIDWETDIVKEDNLVIGAMYIVEDYVEESSVTQCFIKLKGYKYFHSPNKFELALAAPVTTFQHAAGVDNVEPKVETFRDDKTSPIDPLIGAFRKIRRTV